MIKSDGGGGDESDRRTIEQCLSIQLYQQCAALLFPGEEDFGMVPVEAMATGAPVLAYGRGGATETVVQSKTGLFFEEQSVDALCAAIQAFEQARQHFDPLHIRAHALLFDETRFATAMHREIDTARHIVNAY